MSDDLVKRLDQALHFENWMPVPDNFSQAVPLLRESRNRIEELEAKLEKLERWQAAAFIAHGNLDLDIEANPEALAELKGENDE